MAPRKKPAAAVDELASPPPKLRKPRRKAKAEPVIESATPIAMALTETECLKIRTFLAEFRRYNAEATLRVMEKQNLQRQLDPDNRLGLLDQAVRAASENAAHAQAQHNQMLKQVEERLGISIKDFSFDENTGQLWPHNAEPKE
jgi:hypothetical protein